MRRAIILMMVLSSAKPGYVSAKEALSPVTYCRDLSLIGRQVMEARQENRPISEVLPETIARMSDFLNKYERYFDDQTANEFEAKLEESAPSFVMGAYETSLAHGDYHRKIAVVDFENLIFKTCYEEAMSDQE